MDTESTLRAKYEALAPMLNERTRRLWAASEAEALGHGGIAVVARATGLSRTRIARGLQELRSDAPLDPGRVRRPGGGRKRRIDTDVTLLSDLNALVEPVTAGAPDDSPLRWTSKSTRKLAAELQALGHSVSPGLVGGLLHELGYTLQANRKTREGTQHPDRDAQFHYLNDQVQRAQAQGQPVISPRHQEEGADRRLQKRGAVFASEGRSGAREGARLQFIPAQGKAIPYGVYDLSRNEGWVSVGFVHDTAHFEVNANRSWWKRVGRLAYAGASHLWLTADALGSNGFDEYDWGFGNCSASPIARALTDHGLQGSYLALANGSTWWIACSRYIAKNWRGHPLGWSSPRFSTLICRTSTKKGLRVRSEIDKRSYPKAVVIKDEQMEQIDLSPHEFHGDWKYTIRPTSAMRSESSVS